MNKAKTSDVYIQVDDGRYVVKGSNGRVHIWETYGELVTTMNNVTNFKKRVTNGRYVTPTMKQLKAFVDVFEEYLNKSWGGF